MSTLLLDPPAVTSRTEAEPSLVESQAKLVLAMDMAKLASWECDITTGTFTFNENFYALLRTSAAEQGGMIMPADVYARRFLPPEDAPLVAQEIARALATTDPGYTRQFEHRIRRADGSTGVFLVRFGVIKDADGRTVKTFGANQDITDRTDAEQALRVSEDRFRTALHHSPIGIALVATDGRFLDVNPALCGIVGYGREALLARTFQDITHPDDLDRDLAFLHQMLNREIDAYQMEKRYFHQDGHLVWVQLNVSLVWDDGEPRYFVSQIQDITERKRVAADLVAMNERYARHEAALTTLTREYVAQHDDLDSVLGRMSEVVARTLEVSRASVWRLDDRRRVLQCQDLFEWPEGRHSAGQELPESACPAYFSAMTAADAIVAHDAATDPRTAGFATSYLRPNGVSSMLDAPIRAQGVTVGVLCCEQVGTLRRWTPDEQTFVVAVASLMSALLAQAARQQLEEQLRQVQKLEAIGQLAGGIAHDFNNILTVILGKNTLVAEDARLPADLRAAAAEVSESGERAANLTKQLLAFSRRQAIELRVVDLNAVVADVTSMLQRLLGEQVSIEFRYATVAADVKADPGMLDQVLLNLAVNARDAMPAGGEMGIGVSLVNLDLPAASGAPARRGAFVCLTVRDTGCGIEPAHLPHIFEPFFTTKDVGKGTGLGLATTYGIVRQHDGWIDVESQVGRGTTFRVYLPKATRGVEPQAVVAAAAPAPRGRETVLVVEDEAGVRGLVHEVLDRYGYQVLEAATGQQALDVWAEHQDRVDLVVTDVVMPDGMTGFDLAKRLRAGRPGLRVIFTSGYAPEAYGAGFALESGVNFLGKPFRLPDLVKVVRRSLDTPGGAGTVAL